MREKEKYGIKINVLSLFRRLLFVCLLLTTSFHIYAQNEVQFSFGGPQEDYGTMAIQTDDMGYMILAATHSFGFGDRDILLTRTDSIGTIIWSKTIGSSAREVVRTFKKDHTSGYVLLNWVTTFATNDDVYILKIDDEGNKIQEKFFGGPDDDEVMNFDLTEDGGYIFAGSSRNYPGGGGIAIWIIKMDANLNPLWNKTFNTNVAEHSRKIHETADGHYIYIGNRYSSSQGMNHLLMYLDSNGDPVWIKEAGGNAMDDGRDLLITDDGNFIFIGFTESYGAGGEDILAYKLDPMGNLLWAKTYGGSGDEEAYGVTAGLDGNLLIAGSTTSYGVGGKDLIFINIDDDGNLIKANSTGGPLEETMPYVSAASDSGYVVTCGSSSYGNGGLDVLTVKTDNQGVSCCSEEIANLIVQNIGLAISNTSADIGSGMEQPTHNIIINNLNITADLLCYNGIEIFGEDTVCSAGGPFKYYLSPNVDLNFQWTLPQGASVVNSSGDTAIYVQFGTESGYIFVNQVGGCDQSPFDSIYVNVYTDAIAEAGSDESICMGASWDFNNSTLIPSAASYDSVLWTGGLGTFSNPRLLRPVYYADPSEISQVTLTLTAYGISPCGDGSDVMQLTINENPSLDLGNDTTICPGSDIILSPGNQFTYYRWQDGSTEPTLTAYAAGEYWVEVEDIKGCTNADTIFISLYDIPPLSIGNDTAICGEISIFLDAGNEFDQYIWQDGSTGHQYWANSPGYYWVVAQKDACEKSDTIYIDEDCPSSLWFPNCFTPNGDGINDRFVPVYQNIGIYNLIVFNRWGQMLYESNDIDEGWNGQYHGDNCPNGVYFFIAYYSENQGGVSKEVKGSITILR